VIIKKITLENFRQYKGVQTIEFATDAKRNVTIIIGDNTSGKTTIVNAFHWCLYGDNRFDLPNVLLNKEAGGSLALYSTKMASAEVVLVHEGRKYTITRAIQYKKHGADEYRVEANSNTLKVGYLEGNGTTRYLDDVDTQDTINKILPADLSSYFFLDGEHIKSINKKKDVSNAVRTLMGLDVIASIRDYFDPRSQRSVASKYEAALDRKNDVGSHRIQRDIENAQVSLEGFRKKREELAQQLEFCKRRKTELGEKLKENEAVGQLQKEKEDLEADIVALQQNVKYLISKLTKNFSANALRLFSVPLLEKALKVLEEADDAGEGIPEMHADAIKFILDRGRCICGADLKRNEGARDEVIKEQKLLPPEAIGTLIRNYKGECRGIINGVSDIANSIEEDYKRWRDNMYLIETKEKKLKQISAKILDTVNVKKIEEQYNENLKQLEYRQEDLEGNRGHIIRLEHDIDNWKKELEKLTIVNDRNAKILRYIDYAHALYKWFNETYIQREQEVKSDLLESVNSIFTQMYHGDKRKVEIDDQYKIILRTVMGDEVVTTGESKGLEAVKNFSFVGGLVELARKKARNKEEDGMRHEPYPLVMDAPFSVADEKHVKSISKILPESAEQVILIVMDKDWEVARETVKHKVGKSYLIQKVDNSDTHSQVKEVANV
jgi:DNA sulfur modification protein DndD